MISLYNIEILNLIDRALYEDINTGDITTENLIPVDLEAKAFIKAKANGIVAGLPLIVIIYKKMNPDIIINLLKDDGDIIKEGDILATISGSYRSILTGERVVLNFLQRMSGIATETSKYVEALKGYKTQILDTRKTAPGMRLTDKYAVKAGGGTNHRMGLFDMVMIKDNHIDVAGGITNAVNNIRPQLSSDIKIEVETRNIEEVKEALECGVDVIMLDNMDNKTMEQAVEIINGRAKTEASGNVTLERVKEIAELGVDYISVGALTHSVNALDIGLYIERKD